MKSEDKLKSVKRFGARYGRKPKIKFSKIETEQRRLHKCPYCHKIAVKRLAMGIWECRKCEAKFTGKAYSVSEVIIPKESEVPAQEPEIRLTTKESEENYEEAPEVSESQEAQ
ncbi:MAG TPA: 50S ribosomal protein L37ae [Candidatus Nanoarchaeia archaeon]|nr:50S ribosomal protein L37ae [Candidatus Nanoarchaeia archaeon]